MVTTRSDLARKRAAAFCADVGLDRVPAEYEGQVIQAYLEWIAAPKVIGPGTMVRARVTVPEHRSPARVEVEQVYADEDEFVPAEYVITPPVEIEVLGRLEGRYVTELRFLVINTTDVAFEWRTRLDEAEGWWSTGPTFVTVVSESQVEPVKAEGEVWDPLDVVVVAAKSQTVRDMIRYSEDDDDGEGFYPGDDDPEDEYP
jgi:hypothetical protein